MLTGSQTVRYPIQASGASSFITVLATFADSRPRALPASGLQRSHRLQEASSAADWIEGHSGEITRRAGKWLAVDGNGIVDEDFNVLDLKTRVKKLGKQVGYYFCPLEGVPVL